MLPAPMTPILMWNSSTTRRCTFAIHDPQSKIQNSQGGIAQLVERQLCKLEVRGSNPLASSLRSRRRRERGLSRRSLWRRRTSFHLALYLARATTRRASYDQILLCLYSAKRSGSGSVLYRFNRRSADPSQTSQLRSHSSHLEMEAVAAEKLYRTFRSQSCCSARAVPEIRVRPCILKAPFLSGDLRLIVLFSICDLRLSI